MSQDTTGQSVTPRDTPPPMVALHEATFGYNNTAIIHGATLTVTSGDVVIISGGHTPETHAAAPSEPPATTLINGILGLADHQAGTAELFGTTLTEFTDHSKIGCVPQHQRVAGPLPTTVQDVVTGGRLAHLPWHSWFRHMNDPVTTDVLNATGLTDAQHSPVASLTADQHQRLLLARAMVSLPELVIIDHPTVDANPASPHLLDVLAHLAARETSLIIACTDPSPLAGLATQLVTIESGHLTHESAPRQPNPPHTALPQPAAATDSPQHSAVTDDAALPDGAPSTDDAASTITPPTASSDTDGTTPVPAGEFLGATSAGDPADPPVSPPPVAAEPAETPDPAAAPAPSITPLPAAGTTPPPVPETPAGSSSPADFIGAHPMGEADSPTVQDATAPVPLAESVEAAAPEVPATDAAATTTPEPAETTETSGDAVAADTDNGGGLPQTPLPIIAAIADLPPADGAAANTDGKPPPGLPDPAPSTADIPAAPPAMEPLPQEISETIAEVRRQIAVSAADLTGPPEDVGSEPADGDQEDALPAPSLHTTHQTMWR